MTNNATRLTRAGLMGLGLGLLFAAPDRVEARINRTAPAPPGLEIKVDPVDGIFGAPFSIRVQGARPGDPVTLKAATADGRNIIWESRAVFKADGRGDVDLAGQAPESGDYAGADILGLFWSMKPVNFKGPRAPSYSYQRTLDVQDFKISAESPDGRTAAASLRRYMQMPGQGLVRLPLEQDGLEGFLYYPEKGGPFPGVILLSGSGGGLEEWLARAMSSHGFAVLTLAYFDYRNLPRELMSIPIEYFQKAAAWLKGQKAVRPGGIGLAGGSKGGELSLILGSLYPDSYKAIVAWSPGCYVGQGISLSPRAASSWSLAGKDLPCVVCDVPPSDIEKYMKGELKSMRHWYPSIGKIDPALIEKATIAVEKIKAPVLLYGGTEDQTWPADEFCEKIMDRLEKFRFPYEHKYLKGEGAGHMGFLPCLVTANNDQTLNGGAPKANARSGLDVWNETIAFLKRHMGKQKGITRPKTMSAGPGES